jgi:hypothetical protein
MGTLFDQPERDQHRVRSDYVHGFLAEASKIAKEHGIEVRDVIAAKHALEIERANDLRAADGNVFDEQIAGIGEILSGIRAALDALNQD